MTAAGQMTSPHFLSLLCYHGYMCVCAYICIYIFIYEGMPGFSKHMARNSLFSSEFATDLFPPQRPHFPPPGQQGKLCCPDCLAPSTCTTGTAITGGNWGRRTMRWGSQKSTMLSFHLKVKHYVFNTLKQCYML